ncbi:glycosyltransferase family 39 protein [Kiritimatiellaeota bacterium B1221]|nr:glycosyltransferase family 39 protein [Kiritimatiellaeota bacterium B1221]
MRLWQLLLVAALLWVPTAVFSPPTRQQELRVLISARNMLESGNFHRPEFQNQPRFRKPPMAYWMAAGGMALTRNPNCAWAGRSFFILSSLLAIFLITRIAGPSGFHTALIALFSFGFFRYAPLAETDMIQITGLLLFFYAWQRQASCLAGLGISFACLSKGPAGILIPILCLLILLQFYRPDKKFVAAVILIPLLLIGGWILYLMSEMSGLDQMQKDLNATFIHSDHTNPWYYYFYTLPVMMLPGGLWVFWKTNKKEQASPIEIRTAWAWLLVTLFLLMITVSKQRHYALLLIPPAAWLIGMRIQSRKLPGSWIFISLAAMIGMGVAGYEANTDDSLHAEFLKKARAHVQDADTIHVVGINSAVFDFHLGRHVENTTDAIAAYQRAEPGDAIIIIQPLPASSPDAVPLLSQSDGTWQRSLYRKQHFNRNLDTRSSKRE